jgi:hyperosmotically inducible periplasmic protein
MKRVITILALGLIIPGLVLGASPVVAKNSSAIGQQLRDSVHHELLLLPGYTVFDSLGFEVNGSPVRLTGKVTRDELKSSAEAAVKQLPGVRRVVNDIEVLPSSPVDDQIRMAAFRAIYAEPAFRDYGSRAVAPVHILVSERCMTLEGTVQRESDRKAIFRKALTVPGVITVSDRLRLTS